MSIYWPKPEGYVRPGAQLWAWHDNTLTPVTVGGQYMGPRINCIIGHRYPERIEDGQPRRMSSLSVLRTKLFSSKEAAVAARLLE